jgi:hypothetical protein
VAILLARIVEGQDVAVFQLGDSLRLALKALAEAMIIGVDGR